MKVKGIFSTREIWLNGNKLSPVKSQKIRNHSPDGFNWGYGGSGPAQLALAICLEFLSKEKALKEYQQFKWDWVAKFPNCDFEIEIPDPKNEFLCEELDFIEEALEEEE